MCESGSESVLGIRIRIHKAPEYESNTDPDPDPQHWLQRYYEQGYQVGLRFLTKFRCGLFRLSHNKKSL